MGSNDAYSHDGHTVVVEIDPGVDVAAVLGTIAELDIDGARVSDIRDEDQPTVSVEPERLTEVQRQTLLRAVNAGYYATPREVTLTDLSAEFNVSESAVSQRLHGAEATIVQQVVEKMTHNSS